MLPATPRTGPKESYGVVLREDVLLSLVAQEVLALGFRVRTFQIFSEQDLAFIGVSFQTQASTCTLVVSWSPPKSDTAMQGLIQQCPLACETESRSGFLVRMHVATRATLSNFRGQSRS